MSFSPYSTEVQKVHFLVFACLEYAEHNQVVSNSLFGSDSIYCVRSVAKALTACSALLLFQGTPSCSKCEQFVSVLLETIFELYCRLAPKCSHESRL